MTRHTRHTAFGQRCVVAYPYDFVLDGECDLGQQYRSPYIAFDAAANEFAYVDVRIPEDRIPRTHIIPRLWFYPDTLPAAQRGTVCVWRVLVTPVHPCEGINYAPARSIACESLTPVRNEDHIEEAVFGQLNSQWNGTIQSIMDDPYGNSRMNLQILIGRYGADGRDTMPNDARFLKLLLYYTASH